MTLLGTVSQDVTEQVDRYLDNINTMNSSPLSSLVVGDGWRFLEQTGLHYRYFESFQSWTDARCSCQASAPADYTGELASVHDLTTNTFVANLARINLAWLGGFQNSSRAGEPWRWSDGSFWDYENWRSGEPNNANGGEDYLETNYFKQKGKWNDFAVGGSDIVGYVCQYKG